jgi:UDP-N-acetylmuramate dehydrogenase
MNIKLLKSYFPNVELDKSVKELTTFGVGGVVTGYVKVATSSELVAVAKKAHELKIPYLVMAGGSNVVFADKKINKLLVHLVVEKKSKTAIRLDGRALTVEPAVPLQTLAGFEALSGIPGTVGGAIVGNAGAYGQTISDHLVSIEIFDGQKVKNLTKTQAKFKYRDSIFKHKSAGEWLVLSVTFKLEAGDGKVLKQKSRDIIKTRLKKYPPTLKCPGSFFKNVLVKTVSKTALSKIDKSKIIDGKIPAGYLLETAGAKGLRVGGLKVADYHGNLIVNDGMATFADVKKMVAKLKNLVKKRFGIEIEEEVRYLK